MCSLRFCLPYRLLSRKVLAQAAMPDIGQVAHRLDYDGGTWIAGRLISNNLSYFILFF
mgnify:CR=1 FL=1